MSSAAKQRLQGAAGGTAICLLLLGAQLLVADPMPPSPQLDACVNTLPRDMGEVVINRLEPDGDGGLRLKSERHQIVGYGMASVPVSVE